MKEQFRSQITLFKYLFWYVISFKRM